jgi:DcmR-like sensory protein
MPRSTDILNNGEHVMLLYDSDNSREDMVYDCINKEIEHGRTAIYASVNADNVEHLSKLASRINEYDKNVKEGNLKVIDSKQCAERARDGDTRPLDDLEKAVEQTAKEKQTSTTSSHVLVVADCADSLSKDEKYNECCKVEKSWQESWLKWKRQGLRISVICPHLRPILDNGEEQSIAVNHTVKLYAP